MNSQLHSTSSSCQHQQSLKNIFDINQIVQSYKHSRSSNLIYSGHHSNSNNRSIHSPLIIQKPNNQKMASSHNRFMQDDIFEGFNTHPIVENYSMIDERDEQYEPYENVFKGRGQFQQKLNHNMLASSSQNNDVPSRNSSLSSLQSDNHLNISLNNSIERIQKKNKLVFLDDIAYNIKKNSEKWSNSQNQMDIQNQSIPKQKIKQKPIVGNTINKSILPANIVQNQRKNIFFNNQPSINKVHAVHSFRRVDIDSDRQKKQRLQKIQKLQQIGCNCRKSKCLKMYCQCFNLQIFCNQNCNCCGCGNQQLTDDHQKAVLDALTRNPKAFNQVTQKIEQTFNLGIELNEVKKGCKCKKTKCLKKYCECFNNGQGCGKFCKCQGCQNC